MGHHDNQIKVVGSCNNSDSRQDVQRLQKEKEKSSNQAKMDDNMMAESLEADEDNDEILEGEVMGHDTWRQETWMTHLPMRMWRWTQVETMRMKDKMKYQVNR